MKRYLPILVFVMFFISHQTTASNKLEHDELAKQFIGTLNSKELNQIEDFIVRHFSPSALARWEGTGKERYLGYSINSALFHGELKITNAKTENTSNGFRHTTEVYSKNTAMQHEVVVFFNQEQAQSITGWYITQAPKKLDEQVKLTESEFVEEVKAYTRMLAENGSFSGAILIAKGSDVLFSAAHGLASRRYDVKNNLDTKFQIGSMNKMFTSVAILRLVEAGKLSLDDPLTKFIEQSRLGKGEFGKIKIRHLLSHTSGIGDLSGYNEMQSEVRSLKDIQHLYGSIDTRFEPGSQWRYSNTGMMLLGQIIESVTGESYFTHIDKNVYQEAGMSHSGSFDLDVPVKNTARNYWFSLETGQITENLMFQSVKGGPAGGGYSTVGDLHKFALAMQDAKLLSPALSTLALTAKPELNAPNWGLGFSVRTSDLGTVVGHNGAHLGMTARLNMYQEKGYILVVLGNYQSSAWPVVAKVDQLMARLK